MLFICSHIPKLLYTPQEDYHLVVPISHPTRPNIWDKVAYRHLRGMYYIWKNMDLYDYPETITIFQYRRYLQDPGLYTPYSVVCPEPQVFPSVLWQWESCSSDGVHLKEYMSDAVAIVGHLFWEYITEPRSSHGFYHNMYTMPREMYAEHCDFLFDTLKRLEDTLLISPVIGVHIYAFLAERLANYWLWKNIPLDKIKTTPVIEVDKPV